MLCGVKETKFLYSSHMECCRFCFISVLTDLCAIHAISPQHKDLPCNMKNKLYLRIRHRVVVYLTAV